MGQSGQSAHSSQWKGPAGRGIRLGQKLKQRGGRPIDLKRLEELLKADKEKGASQ